MANVFARIRHFWRDKIVGPQLPTYDAACEELGGAPWRIKPDRTDRWFVAQPSEAAARRLTPPEAFLALETGNFDLKKRMSERSKLLLLGSAALAVIVACAVSLAVRPTSASVPEPALAVMAAPAASTATPSNTAQPSTPSSADAHPALASAHPAPRAALPPRSLTSDETRTRVASAKRYTLARHHHR